uniref:guanylate cyclase n=1 Tax=Glossina austeni TaxID=7395 RepID=A0A1A9VGW6_GLOAU
MFALHTFSECSAVKISNENLITQVQRIKNENWALPMTIAANLHIPYKIVMGEDNIHSLHGSDKIGKAIIVTAVMNDISTLRLLNKLETLLYTKVLLIDIMATSFNAKNQFYKHLSRINPRSSLMSNLLLLTVLSDNYRHFLNVAFEDNGIQMVQNFRQLKRLKTIAITDSQHNNDSLEYWPNAKVLSQYFSSSTTNSDDKMSQLYLSDINHTNFTYKWLKACSSLNFFNINDNRHICQHQEQIIENCWLYLRNEQRKVNQREISTEHLIKDLRKLFTQQLCRKQTLYDEQSSTVTKTKTTTTAKTTTAEFENIKRDQQLIANLREFIDFFNFYDFLIANILANKPANASQPRKHQHHRHVPKYDFIVLDVVLTDDGVHSNGGSNTSHYNRINNTSSNNLLNAFNWRPLLILELHEINLKTYITHSIQPGFDDWLLVTNVQLWHCNTICWIIIAVCVGFLLFIVVASVAAGIALRNYLLKKRLSKGPNKIVLSANDFVFPVDSRRVDDGIEAMLRCWLQQLQEFGGPEVDKPDLLKGSIGSLKNLGFIIPGASTNATSSAGVNNATTNGKSSNTSANNLSRHNPALLDMRARYNGDLVQLKEIQMNGSTELKAKAMDLLVMAHGLRHENINPLIGWLADPNRTAMVFDFCSRGSLQDVLIMDEIKLDWSFRLSLLTDLVRGMRYLHSSPLRIHGTLTSRNCVVDARWVLKITDYGLPLFYEAQGIQTPQRTAKELLWTAPELLRAMKPQPTPSHTHQQQQQQQQQQQYQHHHHHHHYSYHLTHHARALIGTPAGDVYSFGIIMQEVVVRGEPYCMLSLSADEIIAKIKKPPPLIRPSVSKGAAPPEAINIMRQCWAEQPEMRPDFNSVYERFKLLNHGRKVNFVDTMFQMLEKYSNNLEELIRERTEQLDMERKKTEQLLNQPLKQFLKTHGVLLRSSVAEKLKMGLAVEPEEFSDVTIYFSDIVGFTTIAAHCTPVQVVDLLNDLYTIFDATINAYNVYKVETIGDAYMVVSGLPVRIPDHAEQIATMALDLLHQSGRFNVKHLPGVPLQLRIGLHTGPCCAGVVGLTMPRSSWRIHMSQETRDRLETRGGYMIEPRGLIDIKGKGMMSTFWLLGKKGFDKPLPNPPPIGLDESLIRNSITLKALANKSRNSTNPSSSQSSSLAGEAVEVKVEITPPANAEVSSNHLQNSYSLDSNSTTTISPNMNLCPEFPSKTPSSSPQSRKISDATSAANVPEHLLCSTVNFNRLPSSAGGSSSRLYKKIEEMLDLSSPYNHYKCLSPSESNLSQFYDGKYIYSTSSGSGSGGNTTTVLANVINLHSAGPRFEKPGSSRLLRRQFSLDRDDTHNKGEYQLQHQHPHQASLQTSYTLSLSTKSSLLDIPILQENSRSPKVSLARIHKQNSSSIAQDLEKIEEIPLSPASSQQHSSLDSNMNKSPPSTIETSIPPLHKPIQYTGSISPPHLQTQGKQITKTSTLFSAPTSPAPSRSLNGISYITGVMESPTTDASTATTSASVTSAQSTPGDNPLTAKKSEISLNVEALLSRRLQGCLRLCHVSHCYQQICVGLTCKVIEEDNYSLM